MDKDLCELFFGVMKERLADFKRIENIRRVKKTLPEIRRKYKCGRLKRENFVRSLPSARRCEAAECQMEDVAYFYESSTCLASSTAANFSELVRENPEFFLGKVRRKMVIICCIAGGIASEMVAVVKSLCREMEGRMQEFLHFQLAFVDAGEKWNAVIESALKELKADVQARHEIKLTSRFVQAQNRQDVLDVIQSADILVSTKFSVEMSDLKEKPFRQLLEVSLQHMKSDSLFFFIDTSAALVINYVEKNISEFGNFQTVYKKDCEYHSLSLDSMEHHLERYSEHFGVDLSSSYCITSARAWLKFERRRGSRPEEPTASTSTSHVSRSRIKNDKKAARKKAYWHRRSVDILCSHADT